jgi:uncharacterized protein (DUF486 family)
MPANLLQHPALIAAVLLAASNLFMTFAWYAHLRNMQGRAWWVAALASWGIALFEYLLQVPANRIGYTLKLDFLWAAICMVGAVYFIFRA